MSYFHPTAPEVPPTDEAMRAGLRSMREGEITQPRAFSNISFHAMLDGLIMTREACYFLTPKGREFINGGEWSNVT